MNIEWLKNKSKEKFYPISHSDSVLCGENADKTLTDTLQELTDNIPSKVSELENDSGYKTTDTTYTLTKEGNTVTFTGTDGYTTSFEVGSGGGATGDVTLADLGITVTAEEINKLDGVTNNIQSDISTLTDHSTNTNVHVTTEEKTAWNKNTSDIVTLTEHSTNTDVHVTTEDKEIWNKNTTDIENITSGTTVVTEATKATQDGDGNVISDTYAKATDVESDVSGLQTQIDNKVPNTRTVNGKALSTDITLSASDVGADASGSAAQALTDAKAYNDTAYANANAYTDTKISELINGAPTTLDTLKEIADAMAENEEVVDALNDAIGTKANQSELDTHTGNNTIHITADERTAWNNKADATALSGYLPLNGNSTIVGTVKFTGNGSNTPIEVNGTYTTNRSAFIRYMYASTQLGYMGFDQDGNPTMINSGGQKELLHAGNYDDYAVPNTGGNITGNVNLVGDSSSSRVLRITNDARYIDTMINPDGSYQVYDGTNSKDIITSSAEGVNTFYGTATGNLSKSGGTIISENVSFFELCSTGGNVVTQRFTGVDGILGNLGFNGVNNPVYGNAAGTLYTLLHEGNYSNYVLPLTGGTITGELIIGGSDTEGAKTLRLVNNSRAIALQIDGQGNFYAYDNTNNKDIFITYADGTTNFYGIATGNLPLTGGGTVDGSIILYSDESVNRYARVRNGLRSVDIAVYDTGSFKIFDYTNNVEIIDSLLDGTTYFNGTATYSKMLSGSYGSDVGITAVPGTNGVRHVGSIPSDTEGLFPHSSNANSILTLNRHEGDFNSQLGFSSDSNVYYRHSTSADWKTILDSSNYGQYALPLIGGSAVGNIGVIRDTLAAFIVNNNTRQARFVADGNNVGIYDIDNSKWLIVSDADGVGTFNGTATGNLPLTNSVRPVVNTANNIVLSLNNTNTGGSYTWVDFKLEGESKGQIGFSNDGIPRICINDVTKDIIHSGNISDSAHLATSSTHGTMSSNDKAKLDSIGDIQTALQQLTITTEWMDTGITGPNLASGSYVVQVSGMTSTATNTYQEIWTGYMSWYSGSTNSDDCDEIILHKAGHASNDRTIYLRTVRQVTGDSAGYLKLQICASTDFEETAVTFKFRKLI